MDSTIKEQITIKGIKEVNNLIDLLNNHFDDLPVQLKAKIKKIENKFGLSDITRDTLDEMYPDGWVEENSLSLRNVISINEVLQKVVVYDNGLKSLYPEHYWSRVNGDIVVEW